MRISRGHAAIASALAITVIGCSSTLSSHKMAHTTTASTPSAAPTPSQVPDPKGRYTGSCDYTLTTALYGNDHLIGEIDATNTGDVPITVKARISWPQEGYAPISRTKRATILVGATVPVRFHVAVPSAGNVINQLQSWQESHNFRSGCSYHVTIVP